MESFEHLCKVALESEGFAVAGNVKFFSRRQTKKTAHAEFQEHGYEVDLVGARRETLVLGHVKSYFGSRGVNRQSFRGLADETKRVDFGGYKILNNPELRSEVVAAASDLYGYPSSRVEMRLYVGKFANGHEADIRDHFSKFKQPAVRVVGLQEIVDSLLKAAERGSYTDDPVIMTVKSLAHAGRLRPRS